MGEEVKTDSLVMVVVIKFRISGMEKIELVII